LRAGGAPAQAATLLPQEGEVEGTQRTWRHRPLEPAPAAPPPADLCTHCQGFTAQKRVSIFIKKYDNNKEKAQG